MRTKKNLKRLYRAFLFSGLMLLAVAVFSTVMLPAQAMNEGNALFIDAQLLAPNEETQDIKVSVENVGKDWEGTVRLTVDGEYWMSVAYDTVISLPKSSCKEFVVRIPKNSVQDSNGTVSIQLINKKGKKVAEEEFYRILSEGMDTIALGILSNDYDSLTYLDMGGEQIYFWGNNYPIRLVEVKQSELLQQLDTLQLLVVDNYNTEILTQEELDAIEKWISDGGTFIVGTGTYAEEVLSGLGDTILDIEYSFVYEPSEEIPETQDYYNWDYMDYVNYNAVHMADIYGVRGYRQYTELYLCSALACSAGDGAIGVLPYSLTEIGTKGQEFYWSFDRQSYIYNMLEEVAGMSSARYNNPNGNYQSYESYNRIERMLRAIGNANSALNFTILEILVVVYVIFVGPILYLILKTVKKREMYWVAVPATVLVGVLLVFLFGRGFEVVNTKAYSVTVEDLANSGRGKSYLYAYNASHNEWSMKMQKGYEYAGMLKDEYRYTEEEDAYSYRVIREGDTLYLGKNPEQSFEDSYFLLGKAKDSSYAAGTFDAHNVWNDFGLTGAVENNTNFDFAYFAVIAGEDLWVFEGLPAGESVDLLQHEYCYMWSDFDNGFNRYQYDFVSDMYDNEDKEAVGAAAALGVGIFDVYSKLDGTNVALIGLVENTEKIVDDTCNEVAYKCVYQIQ